MSRHNRLRHGSCAHVMLHRHHPISRKSAAENERYSYQSNADNLGQLLEEDDAKENENEVEDHDVTPLPRLAGHIRLRGAAPEPESAFLKGSQKSRGRVA